MSNWSIGDRIRNRWEIHRILRGGMGIVYIVYDQKHRNAYAAKTFRDEVFAREPSIADRFTAEALAWVKLDIHQNVTQARMVETIEGKPYIFLEYVSGGDLGDWVGAPRLTEDLPQVLRFAIQFCDGMRHVLAKGIKAHRDIKPQNCLITRDGTLKVSDFGLAKAAAMQAVESGGGGTPEYMAPEQWDSFERADARADIYSFGVMLYEMLIGYPPFGRRPTISVRELERRHREEAPLPLSGKYSALGTMVQTCLVKNPTRRFSSFSEIREGLADMYKRLTGENAPQPVAGRKRDAAELNNKAASLGNLGRHLEELTCYDGALAINPRLAEALSGKGVALRALGRGQEAITCHDRALAINPDYEDAWVNKGVALGELGQYEDELACYDRALAINAHSYKAWNNKGVALGALGQHEAALGCYDRALGRNPRYEDAWLNRGVSLGALGRQQEELACYDRVIEINPRYEMAWHNKGQTLGQELNQWEDAIGCYDRAVELSPRYTKAWYNKGVALSVLGRDQEAVVCYRRAVQLDPQHRDAWFNQGSALKALEQYDEAIACYDRALEINSNNRMAWYSKGLILANHLGRYREALACFEQMERLGSTQAAPVIAKLRKLLGE